MKTEILSEDPAQVVFVKRLLHIRSSQNIDAANKGFAVFRGHNHRIICGDYLVSQDEPVALFM
jgi:hypothetical protein